MEYPHPVIGLESRVVKYWLLTAPDLAVGGSEFCERFDGNCPRVIDTARWKLSPPNGTRLTGPSCDAAV